MTTTFVSLSNRTECQQANINNGGQQQVNNSAPPETAPTDASGGSPLAETICQPPPVGVTPVWPVASARVESLSVGSAGRWSSAYDPERSKR